MFADQIAFSFTTSLHRNWLWSGSTSDRRIHRINKKQLFSVWDPHEVKICYVTGPELSLQLQRGRLMSLQVHLRAANDCNKSGPGVYVPVDVGQLLKPDHIRFVTSGTACLNMAVIP